MVTNKEKLFALGKKMTDRVPYRLGLKKLDESCPEYWGLVNTLDDEMVEIALSMPQRVPQTLAQIAKSSGWTDTEKLEAKLHEMGCNVTSIIGFRSKDIVILEDDFRAVSDRMFLMTDDGSYGRHGNVCVPLNEMFAEGEKFDEVITIGPLIMMKFVVKATQPTGIPCTVSMNPIMVDGTGMCGGCRLTLHRDGESITKFACVDGPDFNGYEVDFDEAMSRGTTYKEFERAAHEHVCNLFKQEVK